MRFAAHSGTPSRLKRQHQESAIAPRAELRSTNLVWPPLLRKLDWIDPATGIENFGLFVPRVEQRYAE
jgi:hypothetical protein